MPKEKLDIYFEACGLSNSKSQKGEYVRDVLEYCKHMPEDPKAKLLIKKLNQAVKVPGFRFFELAKSENQTVALLPKVGRLRYLSEDIIELWSRAHSELVDHACEHLDTIGEDRLRWLKEQVIMDECHDELKEIVNDFVARNPETDLSKALQAFYFIVLFEDVLCEEYDESDKNDEVLMGEKKEIVAESGRDDHAQVSPVEIRGAPVMSEFWQDLFQKLESVPDESEDWDYLPVFIDHLHELKERKSKDRAVAEVRQKIDDLLNQMRSLLSHYLDQTCFLGLHSWSSGTLGDSELRTVSVQLESAQEKIQRSQILQGEILANPFNYQAAVDLAEISRQITSEFSELARFFRPDSGVQPEGFTPVEPPTELEVADPIKAAGAGPDGMPSPAMEDSACRDISEWDKPCEGGVVAQEEGPSPLLYLRVDEEIESDVYEFTDQKAAADTVQRDLVEESAADESQVQEPLEELQLGDAPGLGFEVVQPEPEQPQEEPEEPTPTLDDTEPAEKSAEDIPAIAESAKVDWNEFIANLLIEDDIPGAYWVSKSMEACGERGIPSWLVESLVGSRLLRWDNDFYGTELGELSKKFVPDGSEIHRMLGLAAALKPSVISPSSGMGSWLAEPASLHEAHEAVVALRNFAQRRCPLRSEDLSGAEEKEVRKRKLDSIVREAQEFLSERPRRKLIRTTTNKVWTAFVGTDGPIRQMLLPVSNDSRREAEIVAALVAEWRNREHLEEEVERALGKHIRNTRNIGTSPREQIYDNVVDAIDIGEKWLNAVRREEIIEGRGQWLQAQVRRLRDGIGGGIRNVLGALRDQSRESQSLERRAAAMVLGRAFVEIAQILNIQIDPEWPQLFRNSVEGWVSGGGSIKDILGRRLIFLPELPIKDDLSLNAEATVKVRHAVWNSHKEGRTLADALIGWFKARDFRFVEICIDHIPADGKENGFRHRYRELLDGARLALQEKVDTALESVEQALVDGILLDEDRSEMLDCIRHIQPLKEYNISGRDAELKGAIHDRLSIARKARLEHLKSTWEDLSSKLISIITDPEKSDSVKTFIKSAFQNGEIRVLGETLSHLWEIVEVGKELDSSLFKSRRKIECETLRDFFVKYSEIENFMFRNNGLQSVIQTIREKEPVAGMSYAGLMNDRLESALSGVKAFLELKKSRHDHGRSLQNIREVLSFLGYKPYKGETSRIDIKEKSQDLLFLRASVTATNLARPIPEFGSLVEGALNVLVLWERPVAETITSLVQQSRVDRHGLVVLYLGRMNQAERWDSLRLCRADNVTLAVLDEVLLVYLTKERGERLGTFLRCALPFTAIDPYKPFVQGDVPLEMFYGRKRMADDLQEYSTCLVYGGRQLGKSALLRHVQRSFHHPSLERYALYLEIRNIGAAGSRDANRYQDEVWERIREGLKSIGLLKQSIHTFKAETLRKHIIECLEEVPGRRILVLFDEADNFLDADSSLSAFPVLQELKSLMSDTKRHFKVVFAGLQNVQRFQGIPNQPLAQFGVPLKVGPLDPSDATRLVWEPMEFLGIELDETTVLRILSYTNYHAGLIQFFCKKLIKRIGKKQQDRKVQLPIKIRREDVEAVYRDQAVQDEIRQRLDLTLELDTRYQAITWALIIEQKNDRDSYSRSFSAKEVLDLVKVYWAAGFAETEIDDMNSKLDEMCGLGVLVRSSDGCYRLRSPNMVTLMGTNIESRLEELSTREPEEKFRPDSHHTFLDPGPHYSPLTYSQERDLSSPDFGVSILFTSPALGLDLIANALSRLVPKGYLEEGLGISQEIPSRIKSPETLSDYLSTLLKPSQKAEQFIFQFRPQCGAEALKALVGGCLEFCVKHRQRTSRRWCKIIFVFDPATAENWFAMNSEERDELETRCDAVVSPKLWSEDGIRNRLEQLDKLSSPEVSREIIRATGGWPILVDHLFQTSAKENNLAIPAAEMMKELSGVGSTLRGDFLNRISIGTLPGVLEVLKVFHEIGTIAESDLSDLHLLLDAEGDRGRAREDTLRAVDYLKRMRILHSAADGTVLDRVVKNLHWIAQ
ncbi:hypothetical protein [Syntrophobacter fumaroxidans]|uniref:Uncharacterized protein n=1 Tax=Syntrophobacter fumaroxidans (strain DSM 10017 / MPOB) TaxID=335543 RepID=A0LGD2_SYNFM|nr:hypothetical protein [Syntrophobacter fumaroxidans]ABK16484.1 hypothetical protein Sfum_0786 [Syntrophobacter fumaroxidans MPOB]